MRIHHLRPNEGYVHLANKIADTMPAVGSDQQRGGWYDVVERTLEPDQKWHRFIWHDRKAWWQQEQAILAYYILAGSLGHAEHARLGRESAAFYNAHFLDHDEGGVYFNVLASGIPYLVGNERLKGSHSMSGYHSMELCYLAAVYSNLLVNEEDLELHFKPKAVSFPDGILRVAPDLLPPGSVRLAEVWINDLPYADFDADALTVKLPGNEECRVKVRIVSTTDKFDSTFNLDDGVARVALRGKLDPDEVIKLRRDLERVISASPRRIIINVKELETMSRQGMNELLFFRSKVTMGEDVYIVGANAAVAECFVETGDSEATGGDFSRVADESEVPG
jgi:anti-anti-sigma regulatory factor